MVLQSRSFNPELFIPVVELFLLVEVLLGVIDDRLQVGRHDHGDEIHRHDRIENLNQLRLEYHHSLMLVVEAQLKHESYGHQKATWDRQVENASQYVGLFLDHIESGFDAL